jgi:hypothetical protein
MRCGSEATLKISPAETSTIIYGLRHNVVTFLQ